jgi:TPR repeat protein
MNLEDAPMTPAARIKGAVIGLLAVAAGVMTVLVGTGVVGLRVANAIPCQDAAACEASCAKGHAPDCTQAGLLYMQGAGVERSPARAHDLLRSACDGADAPGCTALGALILQGGGAVPRTELRAIFGKACDGGDAMGCNNLANLYNSEPDRDPPRAWALYQKACERGSGMACSTVAKAYQAGDGVPRDTAQAGRLFARSLTILQGDCDAGNPRACGQAGWLHERGLGGAQDAAAALHDFQSGCDGNDGPSCFNLAVARRAANAGDPTVAALLSKGCELGSREACDLAAAR